MELQLRSLAALTPRDPEPFVEPRMAEAQGSGPASPAHRQILWWLLV